MSNFWDSLLPPPPTKEDLLPPPLNDYYTNIAVHPELIDEAAKLLFPPLSADPDSPDSLIAQVGKPEGFDLPPDQLPPGIFASWHSAFQREYINAQIKVGPGR